MSRRREGRRKGEGKRKVYGFLGYGKFSCFRFKEYLEWEIED